MPAVGRNDPCPCGSGRKFKRCCGASGSARQREIGSVPPQTTPLSLELTGMPGTETTLTVCNAFADPADPLLTPA